MPDSKIRFGVIGAGRIATNQIAPAIKGAQHAVLQAAASRDVARAASLGPTRAYGSFADLIAAPDVDAVAITTHNGVHKALVIDAVRHGKHVLCEKPLAVSARDCEEMVAAAEAADRHLVEAFMYRYHPQIDRALELVRGGAIGELRVVEASFRFHLTRADDVRWHPEWGGGALLDVGCYCVDVTRLFLGGAPQTVQAIGSRDPTHGVYRSVQAVLRYDADRFAVISCGFDAGPLQRVALLGTGGTLHIHQPFSSWRGEPRLVVETKDREGAFSFDPVNTYEAEVDDLAVAILRGTAPKFSAGDAFVNARMLDRLAEAAA